MLRLHMMTVVLFALAAFGVESSERTEGWFTNQVLGISHPHPAGVRTDELCKPLRAFVDSIKPEEKRSIEFHTSWGSNFKDDPEEAFYAKRCIDNDYAPAKAVCKYLMEYGLVEFSDKDAQDAITCLSPGTRFDSHMDLSRIEASFPYGTDDRGSLIHISFKWDDAIGGMILKIDADGY